MISKSNFIVRNKWKICGAAILISALIQIATFYSAFADLSDFEERHRTQVRYSNQPVKTQLKDNSSWYESFDLPEFSLPNFLKSSNELVKECQNKFSSFSVELSRITHPIKKSQKHIAYQAAVSGCLIQEKGFNKKQAYQSLDDSYIASLEMLISHQQKIVNSAIPLTQKREQETANLIDLYNLKVQYHLNKDNNQEEVEEIEKEILAIHDHAGLEYCHAEYSFFNTFTQLKKDYLKNSKEQLERLLTEVEEAVDCIDNSTSYSDLEIEKISSNYKLKLLNNIQVLEQHEQKKKDLQEQAKLKQAIKIKEEEMLVQLLKEQKQREVIEQKNRVKLAVSKRQEKKYLESIIKTKSEELNKIKLDFITNYSVFHYSENLISKISKPKMRFNDDGVCVLGIYDDFTKVLKLSIEQELNLKLHNSKNLTSLIRLNIDESDLKNSSNRINITSRDLDKTKTFAINIDEYSKLCKNLNHVEQQLLDLPGLTNQEKIAQLQNELTGARRMAASLAVKTSQKSLCGLGTDISCKEYSKIEEARILKEIESLKE